jgi:hypothetical protein
MLKDGRPKRNIQKSASFRILAAGGKLKLRSPDPKHFYMAGLFDTVFEHHRAIGALLMFGLSSSALALLRTLIETGYRLIWMDTCASDQAVKRITGFSRRGFPDIARIISDLVRSSRISEFKTRLPNLEILNDFTHSGATHIIRRFQRVGKKEACFEQDAFFCVHCSDYLLFLVGTLFYTAYGEPEYAQTIMQEYFKLLTTYEPPSPI